MLDHLSKDKLKNVVQDLYNEFTDELSQLREALERNEKHIKESEAFIAELRKSSEDDFSIFSPRSIKVDHSDQIQTIREQEESLRQENRILEDKIQYYEERIDQLDIVMDHQEEDHTDTSDKSEEEGSVLLLQELEKQRISRDLHDTTVQNLTHLIHKSEICMKYMETDPIQAKLELEVIHEGLKSSIEELRTILFNLRPSAYDDLNFQSAIEQVVDELKKRTDIKILYQVEGNYDNIEDVILISVIRIMQEACNNAIKYSEAKEIHIDIQIKEQFINMMVKDNGKGMENRKNKKEATTGFGISIMKERAKILNGLLEIKTKRNSGTSIVVAIPIIMKGEDPCQ